MKGKVLNYIKQQFKVEQFWFGGWLLLLLCFILLQNFLETFMSLSSDFQTICISVKDLFHSLEYPGECSMCTWEKWDLFHGAFYRCQTGQVGWECSYLPYCYFLCTCFINYGERSIEIPEYNVDLSVFHHSSISFTLYIFKFPY